MKARMILGVALIFAMCLSVSAYAGPVQTYTLNNSDTAPSLNAPGYGFTYESVVQSPGEDNGYEYTTWWYDYYIENNSTTRSIVAWTWAGGNVIPNPHEYVYSDGSLPLAPATGPSISLAEYCDENFEDDFSFMQRYSTIRWDDGHTEDVAIYVPSNLVPEPSSLMALSLGAVPLLWRRRR